MVRSAATRSLGFDWYRAPRRELLEPPPVDARPVPGELFALLNLWNDRPALEQTVSSWADHVDGVLVVDGAYEGVTTDIAESTDGTRQFLETTFPGRLAWYHRDPGFWPDQTTKRTSLFQLLDYVGGPTCYGLVVDADESIEGLAGWRASMFGADVGWVTVVSSAYERHYSQPRLFRNQPGLKYVGRHHWVHDADDRLVASHQYGGAGFSHRLLDGVTLRHRRHLGRSPDRRSAHQAQRRAQVGVEVQQVSGSTSSDAQTTKRESLRILQLSTYDPGLVAYRFHTAINTTTPHASTLAHRGANNPFEGPHQFKTEYDRTQVARAGLAADIVHCHLTLDPWHALRIRRKPAPALVIHHHGTMFRRDPAKAHREDRQYGAALRLVSNPELLKYADRENDLHYLPNPVPVAWYRALAGQSPGRGARDVWRIGHSPSKRHLKGTDDLIAVVERLRAKGLPLELVLLEGLSHREVLLRKAACDIFFDSFWLGIQCSGLEAAAMGQPVIAGDPDVRDWHLAHTLDVSGGETCCPYTYANDAAELEGVLEQLVVNPRYRVAQTQKVGDYVTRYHDHAAVALRYLDLLDQATGWRGQERGA